MLSYGIAKLDIGHTSSHRRRWVLSNRLATHRRWACCGRSWARRRPTRSLRVWARSSAACSSFASYDAGGCAGAGAGLTNVVMLNFCYDVPVKLNSTYYLAIAIVLALPDVRRILDVFVFAAPSPHRLHSTSLRLRGRRAPVASRKAANHRRLHRTDVSRHSRGQCHRSHRLVRRLVGGRLVHAQRHPIPAVRDDKTRWNRMKFESGQQSRATCVGTTWIDR